jgi:hypothetical protein
MHDAVTKEKKNTAVADRHFTDGRASSFFYRPAFCPIRIPPNVILHLQLVPAWDIPYKINQLPIRGQKEPGE